MTTVGEIPIQPSTNQQMSVSVGGTTYQLNLYWCDPAACWMLDVADNTGNPILQAVPLVPGLDLLAQFAYAGIPAQLLVQVDHDWTAVPTFSDSVPGTAGAALGTNGHLYTLTQP